MCSAAERRGRSPCARAVLKGPQKTSERFCAPARGDAVSRPDSGGSTTSWSTYEPPVQSWERLADNSFQLSHYPHTTPCECADAIFTFQRRALRSEPDARKKLARCAAQRNAGVEVRAHHPVLKGPQKTSEHFCAPARGDAVSRPDSGGSTTGWSTYEPPAQSWERLADNLFRLSHYPHTTPCECANAISTFQRRALRSEPEARKKLARCAAQRNAGVEVRAHHPVLKGPHKTSEHFCAPARGDVVARPDSGGSTTG